MTWTRGRFCIITRPSQQPKNGTVQVEVDGLLHPSGLALHSRGDYIDVTHVASGQRLFSFGSIGPAFEFVERVANWIDWRGQHLIISATLQTELTSMWEGLEQSAPKPTVRS